MNGLISVLLPYRNAERTIGEAVDSVLAQERVELELVAIDDGSADAGPAVVAERATLDPRVVPLASTGRGISAALTCGLHVARGAWVARMDADDVAMPARLALQLEAMRQAPHVAALGTRVEGFPDDALGDGLRRYITWQNELLTPEDHARDLFVESPLCHPSTLLRRDALEQVGGWRATAWPEDYDLWLRLDAAGWALAKLPEVLLRWRHHADRATFRDAAYSVERLREVKAFYLAPLLRARGRPIALWGAGPTGRRFSRELARQGCKADRFIDIDPRKIGRTLHDAAIVAPEAVRRGEHTVVVAVGSAGSRAIIRGRLPGWTERDEFFCVA